MKQGANANSNAGAKMGGDSKMEVKNDAKGGGDAKMLTKNSEQTRSQSVLNKPFDEALEFSQSGSEESIDTARDKKNAQKLQQQQQQQQALQQSNKSNPNMSNKSAPQQQASQPSQPQFSQKAPEKRAPMIEDVSCFSEYYRSYSFPPVFLYFSPQRKVKQMNQKKRKKESTKKVRAMSTLKDPTILATIPVSM